MTRAVRLSHRLYLAHGNSLLAASGWSPKDFWDRRRRPRLILLSLVLGASKAPNLPEVARTLGVGLDCTMVSLMQSAVLVFLLHLLQEKEETALNNATDYTLRDLINRLDTGTK